MKKKPLNLRLLALSVLAALILTAALSGCQDKKPEGVDKVKSLHKAMRP